MVLSVLDIYLSKMRYLLQKSLLCEENKIEINAEICKSLSELGYVRNLQTCQLENCTSSNFFTPQRCCYRTLDDWLLFFVLWLLITPRIFDTYKVNWNI